MKRIIILAVVMLAVIAAVSTSTTAAECKSCTTIQSGDLFASTGEQLTTGYDKWGYNYQAHLFNGLYWNNKRPEPPCEPGTCASDTWLNMKWSDTWLSNKDCNGDGELDRGYSCNPDNPTSSACEGSWVTNHQRGEYVGDEGQTCKWTYFVKIVYPPGGVVDDLPCVEDPITGEATCGDGYDDNTGGSIIWGSYVRIQQVSNDTCAGEHGNVFSVQPTGFGAYK